MKKYEIEICRASYAFVTFGVYAESLEEAKDKAMCNAYSTSFDEDDAEYSIESASESDLSDEEFNEEYGL